MFDLSAIIGSLFANPELLAFVVEKQKDQFWEGKNAEDKDLTPSYLDDPFFKSKDSAKKYMDWKQTLSPSSSKNPETPNLFINGKLVYDNVTAVNSGDKIIITIADSVGNKLESKYDNLLGLTDANLNDLINTYILPELNEILFIHLDKIIYDVL